MNARWTVEVVCTDRGQHKRTWIARMIWDDGSGWRTFVQGSKDVKHDMWGPPDSSADPGSVESRESYGAACSRCTRWPKIKRGRWIRLMDAARLEQLAEFDVSYLD